MTKEDESCGHAKCHPGALFCHPCAREAWPHGPSYCGACGPRLRWFWLMFEGGGAALVQGENYVAAVERAWALGMRGELGGMAGPWGWTPLEPWTNRLLSPADCLSFDKVYPYFW